MGQNLSSGAAADRAHGCSRGSSWTLVCVQSGRASVTVPAVNGWALQCQQSNAARAGIQLILCSFASRALGCLLSVSSGSVDSVNPYMISTFCL